MNVTHTLLYAADDNATQLYPALKWPLYIVFTLNVTYGLIFLCALVGNIMVLVVVATTPCMHTVTNFFIANLAVVDILAAIFCIPASLIDNIFTEWQLGALLCKVTPYIQGVCVNATAYVLVAIAVDRFLAICLNKDMHIMKRSAIIIICLIWILSFILFAPWAVYYEQYATNSTNFTHSTNQSILLCSPVWSDYGLQKTFFVVVLLVGAYLIPLTVIFICYALIARRVWYRRAPGVVGGTDVIQRCKVNVLKMLATVVLMFALSWLPLYVIYILLYFFHPINSLEAIRWVTPVAQWLGLSNFGINAFIYSFFSQKFRRGFFRLWLCMIWRRTPQRGSLSSRRVTRTVSVDSSSLARYSFLTKIKIQVSNGQLKKDNSRTQMTHLKSRKKRDLSCTSSLSSEKDQTFV
ncbi:neuropeptide FF receptor 1 [Biomphalaria pfeifferi]|uniref:Neuropeptide FF receptor 1 n=1 Tax=Biomphalaria pfeifferi TaxID=112525 RepID=A0AAD8F7X3_BIOPF|nr:neuropeptide FF receptor 1 [Biomphalaria pfeifferi]